ncbi:hypothetical protein AYR66_10115 [Noviherbaspirillum denitrificans]|uniref:Uncharacterized protein n=1 Tax=Noviherbaspirillum denitrificans TaxID=1968433 RepID=A0A254TGY7_9BURK|nr:hypothetical protein AYR66_10115 [Noviherbaspirillum denitrificans]
MLLEFSISLVDTLHEDRTRPLSALERIMHVVLLINFGAYNAFLLPVLLEWRTLPTGFALANHGVLTWLLTGLSVAALAWSVRDAVSYVTLGKRALKDGFAASAG